MTKDELYNYIQTGGEKGVELNELIAATNIAVQNQLIPPFFKGSEEAWMASDFIFDELVGLLAKASDYVQHGLVEDAIEESLAAACPLGVAKKNAHLGNILCQDCDQQGRCSIFIPF